MADFDLTTALEQYRRGLPEPGRTSTQSWGIEEWSQQWRDAEGRLDPARLSATAAAFWFRALTEPTRLGDDRETARSAEILAETGGPLQPQEAVDRLRAFVVAADEALTHWPQHALAPVALPMRAALGATTTRRIIEGAVAPAARASWIEWLGPLSADSAQEWVEQTNRTDVIEALADAADIHGTAVDRLTELGATDQASRLAERLDPQRRARWTLRHRRTISLDLLRAAVGSVDDDTWVRLCRKVLSRRDREVWEVLARRPRAALVPRVLEKLSGPVAGWILDWFALGDDTVVDELIGQALGRSARRKDAALRVLAELNNPDVRARIDQLPDAARDKLEARLGPVARELPELPRAQRSSWMEAFAGREPQPAPWLAPQYLPTIETGSGHRLPDAITRGLIATLQEVRLSTTRDGAPADRYDAGLSGIADALEPESLTRWWNGLFGQWWSADRPADGAWVLTAAAFVGAPGVVRDLGNSLHHYRKWFGDHAVDVLHALRLCGSPWAIAILDDTARRGRSEELRSTSRDFLVDAATRAGLTVDAFVETNLPDDTDDRVLRLVAERLEDSMVEGRDWSGWSWKRRLERPPFAHVAESILWAVTDPDGHVLATFRFDGEGPVGLDDEPFEVVDDDVVAVTHPAAMTDDALRRANQTFVDYELVQPFEQISRERYRHASLSADGFRSPIGKALDCDALFRGARDLGWREILRGAHGDVVGFRRTFQGWDVRAELWLSSPTSGGECRLDRLGFATIPGEGLDPAFVPAVPFSETHRDLVRLAD